MKCADTVETALFFNGSDSSFFLSDKFMEVGSNFQCKKRTVNVVDARDTSAVLPLKTRETRTTTFNVGIRFAIRCENPTVV